MDDGDDTATSDPVDDGEDTSTPDPVTNEGPVAKDNAYATKTRTTLSASAAEGVLHNDFRQRDG